MTARTHTLVAILPCNDLPKSHAFYARLGFQVTADYGDYLLLADEKGAELHLHKVGEGFLDPKLNPCGLYLYAENVDELASHFAGEILGPAGKPEHKPWRMYEFAVSDPDEALVRIGWPSTPRP